MQNEVTVFSGKTHIDSRGTLIYFNEFDLATIKRMYIIEHSDTNIIRAWQGHQKEQKWFYIISGSFKIILIKIDNWQNPSADLSAREFILTQYNYQVLHVEGGYVSGFRALKPNSRLMIFSDFSLMESLGDDFRYDKHKWYNWAN